MGMFSEPVVHVTSLMASIRQLAKGRANHLLTYHICTWKGHNIISHFKLRKLCINVISLHLRQEDMYEGVVLKKLRMGKSHTSAFNLTMRMPYASLRVRLALQRPGALLERLAAPSER